MKPANWGWFQSHTAKHAREHPHPRRFAPVSAGSRWCDLFLKPSEAIIGRSSPWWNQWCSQVLQHIWGILVGFHQLQMCPSFSKHVSYSFLTMFISKHIFTVVSANDFHIAFISQMLYGAGIFTWCGSNNHKPTMSGNGFIPTTVSMVMSGGWFSLFLKPHENMIVHWCSYPRCFMQSIVIYIFWIMF